MNCTRRLRNARGGRRGRPSRQLGEAPQVLRDRGERELVLCAAGPAQAEPAESEDALEVGKQHLDALAVTAGLLEGLCLGERSSHVAGVLVDVAQNAPRWHVGAALGFERACSTIAYQCIVADRVVGAGMPRSGQRLPGWTGLDIRLLVPDEVLSRDGA